MDYWIIWYIAGLILLVLEIFIPGFFFLGIGTGAIVAGSVSMLTSSLPVQFFTLILISLLGYYLLRRRGSELFDYPEDQISINSLRKKTGMVTQNVTPNGKGYVRAAGEEWRAVTEKQEVISEGEEVKILAVTGNKLIVTLLKRKTGSTKRSKKN
jgi:membrane protein implicated in regulation of membrane protease activity